jgi:hypothetical protein
VSAGALSLAVEPAYRSVPPYTQTLGPEVAGFCASIGFGPDPEQEMILGDIFARGTGGRSAAMEIAVIAPRQNLKTGVKKQAALGWLFVTDERLVVWSAHEWDTVKEAFRDLDELITGSDALRRRVKHIYRGNGDEAIELLSGARLIFKTRTKVGGRGLSGRKVILDEGFALRAMHMGALLPALSAQPDPQVLYGSSAAQAESEILHALVERGRAGGDPGLAYTEFCAPPPSEACAMGDACTHARETAGCGCDDPANWARANTAMARGRITAEYIAGERRALPPAEFGRERMGWHDAPAEGVARLDPAVWASRADPGSQIAGRVALAFAVAPDGSSASVAVAGRRADGLGHGELTDPPQPGTAWLMGRVLELAAKWDPCVLVINPAGAAGAFEKELIERGFAVVPPGKDPLAGKRRLQVTGAREYAQACGALAADVANDQWRHLGQEPLDTAVKGARTRTLADAWAWSWQHSAADIGPLEAVTLARHGFMTHGTAPPQPFFGSWR